MNAAVEKYETAKGENASNKETSQVHVVEDVVLVESQLGGADADPRAVHHRHRLQLEEFWRVEERAEYDGRRNVEGDSAPGTCAARIHHDVVLDGPRDGDVTFDGQHHRHVDGARECHVLQLVEKVNEDDDVNIRGDEEFAKRLENAAENKQVVKHGETHEESVEDVAHLLGAENGDRGAIGHESRDADDAFDDALEPKGESLMKEDVVVGSRGTSQFRLVGVAPEESVVGDVKQSLVKIHFALVIVTTTLGKSSRESFCGSGGAVIKFQRKSRKQSNVKLSAKPLSLSSKFKFVVGFFFSLRVRRSLRSFVLSFRIL